MTLTTTILVVATMFFGIHSAELIFVFGVLIWISMLLDCLYFNTHLTWKQKLPWLLVLIFVAPIGTLLYFFVPFLGRLLFPQKSHTSASPIGQNETYTGYEDGYRQKQTPAYQPSPQSYPTTEEQNRASSSLPLYEQPQASYPEMTE